MQQYQEVDHDHKPVINSLLSSLQRLPLLYTRRPTASGWQGAQLFVINSLHAACTQADEYRSKLEKRVASLELALAELRASQPAPTTAS
jgi:hypothetical protein